MDYVLVVWFGSGFLAWMLINYRLAVAGEGAGGDIHWGLKLVLMWGLVVLGLPMLFVAIVAVAASDAPKHRWGLRLW